jgi:putative transposase
MGFQIPCGHRTKVSKESPVWENETGGRRDFKGLGETEGDRSAGRPPEARPRPYVFKNFASKYSVAFALGFMKGKSAVRIHRKAGYKKVTGMHFWSRGYCVSTVGLDEETIKKYIREQEKQKKEQLELFD